MNPIAFKYLGIAILLTLQAPFWGACPKNVQSSAQISKKRGTGDGGGGSGMNDKMYESFIVKIAKLPAYKRHLLPLFDKLDADARKEMEKYKQENGVKSSKMIHVSDLVTFKDWYFVPTRLLPLPKEMVGVTFLEGTNQLLAWQTSKSVWIDSNLFSSKKGIATNEELLKKQGFMLMHEFVVAIYRFKFKRMSEINSMCQEILQKYDPQSLTDSKLHGDKEYPPAEPERDLNSDDYENIRRVTNYLMSRGAHITLEEFRIKLLHNGFDSRFFRPLEDGKNTTNDSSAQGQLELTEETAENIISFIKETDLVNKKMQYCDFGQTKGPTNCRVQFSEPLPLKFSDSPDSGIYGLRQKVEIFFNDDLSLNLNLGFSNNTCVQKIGVANDFVYHKVFVDTLDDETSLAIDDWHVGLKFRENYLILKQPVGDSSNYYLQVIGLVSVPFVVSSQQKLKNGNIRLKAQVPKPDNISNDVFFLYHSDEDRTIIGQEAKMSGYGRITIREKLAPQNDTKE